MSFENIFLQLEKTPLYRSWKQEHADDYLVHILLPLAAGEWYEIGFYREKDEILTTFAVRDTVTVREDTELARIPGETILCLNRDDLICTFDVALAAARAFVQEKYPHDPLLKTFGVVQRIPLGSVFNFTFVSSTFKTITVRLDTRTGNVIDHRDAKIAEFLSTQ